LIIFLEPLQLYSSVIHSNPDDIVYPSRLTSATFVMLGWAILTGVLQIGAAIQLRKYLTRTGLLALAGAVSIIYSLALYVIVDFALPQRSTFFSLFWAYPLCSGIPLLAFGISNRRKGS